MSKVGLGVAIAIIILIMIIFAIIAYFIIRGMMRPKVIVPVAGIRPNIPDGIAIPQEVPVIEENIPIQSPVTPQPQEPATEISCSTGNDCPPGTLCLGGRCISL